MNKDAKFWNRHAEGYAKSAIADQAAYEEKLRITREYLKPEMNVLEFGCGTGSTALLHAPLVKHIHAIDISSKMIEIANRKLAEQDIANITFEQQTIEGLPEAEGQYDVILGLSILHLLENKEEVLEKVLKLLKPGGVFVSSTVCMADRMSFFKYIAPLGRKLGLLPILKIFSEQNLLESMENSGFSIDYHWKREKGKAVFMVAKKPV